MSNTQFEQGESFQNDTLLAYYIDNGINPVPISLLDDVAWQIHVAKRRNLYERHLGIPLSLLRDRSIIEFGCNSGENSLVLASMGANLTLVEPNPQAVARLVQLFSSFGLRDRLVNVVQESIEEFEVDDKYDVVIAEGFLSMLEHRDQMLDKLFRLISPGGLAIISFNDRIGHLLEIFRKLLFWRVYRVEGLTDVRSAKSLALARRLFDDDFNRLNASRPFEAWYDDVLASPFILPEYFWSYQEIIPFIEQAGCELHSTSPAWCSVGRFAWYKDVLTSKHRHQQFLTECPALLPFFLTGLSPAQGYATVAASEVTESVLNWGIQMSRYIRDPGVSISSVSYPEALDDYLSKYVDPKVQLFNKELKNLHLATRSNVVDDIIEAYQETECLRHLWGAPYHYLSVGKPR